MKLQIQPILWPALVLSMAACGSESLAPTQAEGIVAEGVFRLDQCIPERMAPGFTLVYPLEGSAVYWFRDCEVVRVMDMPGPVSIVRQDEQGIYGHVGNRILALNADGSERFSFSRGKGLPGPAHHDIIATSRGTYFTLTRVQVGSDTFDDQIVEVTETGEVLWTWSVNQHLLGSPDGARNLAGENWMHSNSLDVFDNGDILLSARNINEIVRISFPEGQVLWRRGGDLLSLQHHALIQPDGSITVFDNGVTGRLSGVVKFGPDGSVVLNERLDFFSNAFGSAEELSNGNWFVVDGRDGRALEYTPDLSNVVFELKLLRGSFIPFAENKNDPIRAFLYRAHRVSQLP